MKIRFVTICATDRQCFVENEVRDLPEAEAAGHIRAGHAVADKDAEQKARPKPQPK